MMARIKWESAKALILNEFFKARKNEQNQ